MALPRWLARFNGRFMNPGQIAKGQWPVLVHVGRNSGTTYQTPLAVYPTDDGRLAFTVNYGARSDWPRNVVVAGRATLIVDGDEVGLVDPVLVPVEEAYDLLASDAKTPPSVVGVRHCLVMSPEPNGAKE